MNYSRSVTPDPWTSLQPLTAARIALGRTGGSLPTNAVLKFDLAHARARDAVHCDLNPQLLARDLAERRIESLTVFTDADDRNRFLQRPDLGRRLSPISRQMLIDRPCSPVDVVFIVADGLAAVAAHRHAVPLLNVLTPKLLAENWTIAPVVIAVNGRVALEDEIGQLMNAQFAVILLGERPGLGAHDSLGAYFIYQPRPQQTDAQRNCVSNIRPEGNPVERAADTLFYLLTEARSRKLSGVQLKDLRRLPTGAFRTLHSRWAILENPGAR